MIVNTRQHTILKNTKRSGILLYVVIVFACSSCFKNLPAKNIVYENGFEAMDTLHIKMYDARGPMDSLKITDYNGSKVLGRFNTNFIVFTFKNLPFHNIVRIEFDLFMHDQWTGEYKQPGSVNPDVWQMKIDNRPVYLTTFSNGPYTQAFPDNHSFGSAPSSNPARANAWAVLPGVCGYNGKPDGTTLYKIDYTTAHSGQLEISMNDVLQISNSLCLKSWSIDNLRITAIEYK